MAAPKNQVKEGKPRPHLIPIDVLMDLLCPAYEEGLIKYVKESWREGFNHSVMYDACMRHLKAFYFDKEDFDQEALEKFGIKKHHLGGAIFALISMYVTHMTHPELDDRGLNRKELQEFLAKDNILEQIDCAEVEARKTDIGNIKYKEEPKAVSSEFPVIKNWRLIEGRISGRGERGIPLDTTQVMPPLADLKEGDRIRTETGMGYTLGKKRE